MMKIVYIAHPIGAETQKEIRININKVKKIIRELNLKNDDVLPFAHYLVDLDCLNDRKAEERERGIKNDHQLMRSGFIDELWLYGNRISRGMYHEIIEALRYGIVIVPKTEKTAIAFQKTLDFLLTKYSSIF